MGTNDSARFGEPRLGVIIPTLDESATLPELLDDLSHLPFPNRIVVADGGSVDDTGGAALSGGARVVGTEQGRAWQMNAGARAVRTPWLLFLHADSRLPPESRHALVEWLRAPPPEAAGYFRFRLDDPAGWARVIELGQRARERLTGLVYGDQGLLVSRARLEEIGGIPELPLMEDVEAVWRLRRSGGIVRIDAPLPTSSRRYREEGILRTTVRNTLLMALHVAGVAPERLARHFAPRSPRKATSSGRKPILIVFAKAPRPGEVKSRLARDVGDERAAEIYREIGRRVVGQVRHGRYRVIVHYTPDDAEAEVRRWLGEAGLEFRPQRGEDLGERMAEAFRAAFEEAERVCIVGTDSPDLDRTRVESAMDLLDRGAHALPLGRGRTSAPGPAQSREGNDAIFGPALDGGYYLLALRRPVPELFRDIPWGTSDVLRLSLRRARSMGLRVHTVEPLPDVDRVDDLPPELSSRRD